MIGGKALESALPGGKADQDPNRLQLNRILFCVCFFTSSFDVFLNFKVMGFSLRFCYLIILLLLFLNASNLHRYLLRKPMFLGFVPLAIWTMLLLLFIPNTQFLARNIGYMGWHVIHIGFIVLLVQSINRVETFLSIYRAYIVSFVAVALFGLLQFALGLAGVDLLVTQWWMPRLPRINGFSYEPSYFGTYLLIGWIQIFLLSFRPMGFFRPAIVKAMLLITSVCLILSSSRMSILVAVLFVMVNGANQLLILLSRFRMSKSWVMILFAAAAGIIGASVFVVTHWDTVKFLFAGFGFGGGSKHSSAPRMESLRDTFGVFLRSPIIGVSLGGIAPAIAEGKGVIVASNEAAKSFEGSNIFVEMLGASGLFGIPFFIAYISVLFFKPLSAIRRIRKTDPLLAFAVVAMLVALLFELFILSMNQNILRPFLWIHIGMISLAYKLGAGSAGSGQAAVTGNLEDRIA